MFYDALQNDLHNDLIKVLNIIPNDTNGISIGVSENGLNFIYDGKEYYMPYRIYYKEPNIIQIIELSNIQKMILYCIYLRHYNGYIREKYLRLLLDMDYERWTIPFIQKICDEYVIELLEIVYCKLHATNTDVFKRYCAENHEFFSISFARMASYWNEYYRKQYPHFSQYIGRKLYRECFGYNRSYEKSKL